MCRTQTRALIAAHSHSRSQRAAAVGWQTWTNGTCGRQVSPGHWVHLAKWSGGAMCPGGSRCLRPGKQKAGRDGRGAEPCRRRHDGSQRGRLSGTTASNSVLSRHRPNAVPLSCAPSRREMRGRGLRKGVSRGRKQGQADPAAASKRKQTLKQNQSCSGLAQQRSLKTNFQWLKRKAIHVARRYPCPSGGPLCAGSPGHRQRLLRCRGPRGGPLGAQSPTGTDSSTARLRPSGCRIP